MTLPRRLVTGTTDTLLTADADALVVFTGASPVCTYPTHAAAAITVESIIVIEFTGTGTMTVQASSGMNFINDSGVPVDAGSVTLTNGDRVSLHKETTGNVKPRRVQPANTDLSYDAATRVLASSTGADVTLPLVSITNPGLAVAPERGPQRFFAHHDCLSATGNDDWSVAVAGTGAAFSSLTPQGSNGVGWVRLAMGTVATNRGAISSPSFTTMLLNLGPSIWIAKFRIPVLSDATNTYSMRSGFIDTVSAESTDGVFFRYTHSVNSGKWQAVTRANSVETAVDTGITAAINTDYKLEVRVNATGTSADFYINGTLTNTITTNIPTGAGRETGYGHMVLRSVGTATFNSLDLDYVNVEQEFTGR